MTTPTQTAINAIEEAARAYRSGTISFSMFTDTLRKMANSIYRAGQGDCEKPDIAKWFKKGQLSVRRKNKSGCCCIIDDDDRVVSACGAHLNWRDESNNNCGCENAKPADPQKWPCQMSQEEFMRE